MPFSLEKKTCVITGASSGIGLAIAKTFFENGGKVMMLDLNRDQLDQARRNILADAETGGKKQSLIEGFVCDVTNEQTVETCFAKIAKKYGRVDVLVNNAGISSVGTVQNCTEEEFDRVYRVNVTGVFFCLKYAVNHMLADGEGGAIVNLASIASVIGLADRFAYSMTKGAVLTMTLSVVSHSYLSFIILRFVYLLTLIDDL